MDVTARAHFHQALIRDLEDHPRTVVLSTHLIEESESLFDRVVIMERGRVAVDTDRDAARDLAFVVSGTTGVVERVAAEHAVLRSNVVGGLTSVTVSGAMDPGLRADAERQGARITAASLQELVSAYGAQETELTTEGLRA